MNDIPATLAADIATAILDLESVMPSRGEARYGARRLG